MTTFYEIHFGSQRNSFGFKPFHDPLLSTQKVRGQLSVRSHPDRREQIGLVQLDLVLSEALQLDPAFFQSQETEIITPTTDAHFFSQGIYILGDLGRPM